MKTIVIDARQYTTSTGRYTYRLVEYLEKIDNGHNYKILLKPTDMNIYDFSNPHFVKVSCPYQEFTFNEQIGFLKQLQSLKPDLVHFAMPQQPILYSGKVVTTIHDLTTARFNNPDKDAVIFYIKQLIFKYVVKRVANKSRLIITPSQFVKKDLVKFSRINPMKVNVTYEAADKILGLAEPISSLKNKRFIMYVGRPNPHKNLARLLKAFYKLHKIHPDLFLVLAGKKDNNYKLLESTVTNQFKKYVYFTDYVNDHQLKWLYENCQAYIFPSLSEGFGLPGLEAMVHGAAVISSSFTCLPEIYGQAASYFNPLSVDNMAEIISQVLNDPKLKGRLIKEGKKKAAEYSWRRLAEQTLDVYQQALND